MPTMRLWPGFCPGPHWGSLQRSPRPLAGFKGPTFIRERVREGMGMRGEGKRRWGGEKGKGK